MGGAYNVGLVVYILNGVARVILARAVVVVPRPVVRVGLVLCRQGHEVLFVDVWAADARGLAQVGLDVADEVIKRVAGLRWWQSRGSSFEGLALRGGLG